MKKKLFFIWLCTISLVVKSQDSNNALLQKLVEKNILTQSEVDEITKETEKDKITTEVKQPSVEATLNKVRDVFSTPYLKLGGYGLLTYRYRQFDKSHHDLRPRVVYLTINGKLTETISYGVMFEMVNPALFEYYAEWSPLDQLKFKVGQFKVPFTIENTISTTNLETIYNTRSISNLVGMSDDVLALYNKNTGSGRDIGIQLSGSLLNNGNYNLIEYWAGIFQGTGINMSDANNDKDFAGTLLFQPIKGFRIGGGAYFGEATYKASGEDDIADHVRNRWALSSDIKTDRFYARAEWLHGNDAGVKKEGLYGTALYYLIPEKLNVVGKVDYFNKNKDTNSEVMDYTCGVNYYFYPRCRLQLNYTYSDYSKNWDARNTNMVAAQMQIVF